MPKLGVTLRSRKPIFDLNSIQQLAGGSLAFGYRGGMSGVAGEIGIGKGNASEGGAAQDLARRRLAVLAEEKSRLRTAIGVPPAVEDDAGDIALGVEARSGEHLGKLLARLSFIIDEGVERSSARPAVC